MCPAGSCFRPLEWAGHQARHPRAGGRERHRPRCGRPCREAERRNRLVPGRRDHGRPRPSGPEGGGQRVVGVERQSGGTGSCGGVETTAASTVLVLKGGVIDATVQGGSASVHDDVLQSSGTIQLEDTTLVNNDAGGLGFTSPYSSYEETWFSEGLVNAAARFLFPGTAIPSANEIFRAVTRPTLIKAMRVRARVASGGGNSTTFTLRLNGAATGITVTIAGGTTEATITTVSVPFAIGDDISIQQTQTGGWVAADIAVTLEMY